MVVVESGEEEREVKTFLERFGPVVQRAWGSRMYEAILVCLHFFSCSATPFLYCWRRR